MIAAGRTDECVAFLKREVVAARAELAAHRRQLGDGTGGDQ